MADSEITDLGGLAKIANSKLAEQIYADGLQKGTKEAGELLSELSKTTRMVLQPVFTALQGASARMNSWVAEAISNVPPERLVEAKPAVLRATVAAIGTEDDRSELRGFYVKLLASMVDRDLQDDVHPSFPHILQELSPLDATLLQITPFGTEVELPSGVQQPPYHFSSGLVEAWEAWKDSDAVVGQYRFFRQVNKMRAENIAKTTIIGKAGDHAGFLEIVLPQQPLFRDRGLGWHNLERLRLVSKHDERDVHGYLKGHFWTEPDALGHLKSLLIRDPHFHTSMYYRTSLGRSFASCCVPTFSGNTVWHPVPRDIA